MINIKNIKYGEKRKYRKSIYLWVYLGILGIVVIFSYILFLQVQRFTIQKQNQINKAISSQIQFSLKLKNDTIKDLCGYLYYNANVSYVMDLKKSIDDESVFVQVTNKINKLKSSVITINPYIHSIEIYNPYNNHYFGTHAGILYKDLKLLELMDEYKILPIKKPIYRQILLSQRLLEPEKYTYVLTYPIYENYNEAANTKAVFVNINPQWFFDSIKEFNKTNVQPHGISGEFFLIDNRENIIREIQSDESSINNIKTIYTDRIKQLVDGGDKVGYVNYESNNEKFLVSYSYIDDMDWILINVTPYKIAFNEVNKMLRNILITIGLFVLISLIVAFIVSNKIYIPIERLIKGIRKNSDYSDRSTQFDEIAYIENIYSKSVELINDSLIEKNKNENILKSYHFKNLLLNENISKEEVEKFTQDYGIDVENTHTAICVLRIDRYGDGLESYLNDIYLLKFVICNIFKEVIEDEYINETINIQNDTIAIIINIKDYSEAYYDVIKRIIKNAQQYILARFGASISASLSEVTLGRVNINKNYQKALENSKYKCLFGNMCIIVPRDIKVNIQNTSWNYPFEEEKKFIESLKSGNVSMAEQILGKMLDTISTQNFHNIQLSINYIINTIRITLTEIENVKLMKSSHNLEQLLNFEDLNSQTIASLYSQMVDVINKVLIYDKSNNTKRKIVVDTIIEMIQCSYSDATICSKKIADTLKMSVPYISRIFKEERGQSIANYIEDFRLSKAAELLIISNYTVTEIVTEVGMQNESNFYKRFKAKYALTPKEYSFKYSRHKKL